MFSYIPRAPVSDPKGMAESSRENELPVTTSLRVSDLDPSVTDSNLYDWFNGLGSVVSVRVCRNPITRESLGYGYVNYCQPADAARALETLNFTHLNGKQIRITYSFRDSSFRKDGAGNIFVKNLDETIDNKALYDLFSKFGNILSSKIATDTSGRSKGYGFVQFYNEGSAKNAIEKLNGVSLNDKQIYVGPFLSKNKRDSAIDKTKFNNVYVKNLSASTTEDDLMKSFGEYGTVTSAVIMRDVDGKSKCFGFVNFKNPDDATQSVDALNGKTCSGRKWYVGKAQKKSERETEIRARLERLDKEEKFEHLDLCINNLDDSINDDILKNLFSEFGTITTCKVLHDSSGRSRGSGFISFSSAEEASRALVAMNGKMIVRRPLYVHPNAATTEPDGLVERNGENQFVSKSLYVTGLDLGVTDYQLHNLFSLMGVVEDAWICRDSVTKQSLGYGYVNYSTADDALQAFPVLNQIYINGKPIQITYCFDNSSSQEDGKRNVFVKGKSICHE